jgi:hypothetical protein
MDGTEHGSDTSAAGNNPAASRGESQSANAAASEVIISAGAENHPTPAPELLRAEAGDIRANQVSMDRAGAERITADRVIMTNSGARSIDADSAQIDRSGILTVRADKAVFSNTTTFAVATNEARITRSNVFALKTGVATFEGEVNVAVYAGPPADGMRPLLDAPAAAAFGAGLGAALLLLGGLLRRIIRR